MGRRTYIMNIDEIAKFFGLGDFETLEEMNQEYIWECGGTAYENERDRGETCDVDERSDSAREKAEQEAQTAIWRAWRTAVLETAESVLGAHGMYLKPIRVKRAPVENAYDFSVESKDWKAAVSLIRDTINGVGDFYFASDREFLASGPYTAREACLRHIGYVRRRAEVYGEPSARFAYDSALESYLRMYT